MSTVGESARIVISKPGDEAGDVVHNAWLLWKSALGEAQRKGAEKRAGYVVMRGAMSGHVMRLWPTMEDEERLPFQRGLYAYLRSTRQAVCVSTQNPTIWHLKSEWVAGALPEATQVVFSSGSTRAERRVTPEEAGETLAPGEVTVRQKEAEVEVPSTNPARVLAGVHKQRRDERDTRRAMIAEFVQTELDEPAVVEEVAHWIGVNPSTARADLNDLVARGVLFSRLETSEERVTRYGGTAFARRSSLYWGTPRIPTRSSRQIINGFAVETTRRDRIHSSKEINRKVWAKLKKKGPRSTFTAIYVAECAGLDAEAIRNRFRQMEQDGLITRVGTGTNNQTVYKMANKDGVRQFLKQPADTELIPVPESVLDERPATLRVKSSTPTQTPAVTVTLPQSELDELLALLDSQAARIAELEAQQPAEPSVTSIAARIAQYK